MSPAGTILIAYLTVAIPAPVRSVIPTDNWNRVENILTVLSAEALLSSENEDGEDEDRVNRSESRRPSTREERNPDRQSDRRDRRPDGPDSRSPGSRDRDGAERRETGTPESDRPSRSEKPDSDKGPDSRRENSRPPVRGSRGEGQPPGFGFPMPFGMPPGFNVPRREADKPGPPALRSGPFAAGPDAGFPTPGRSPFGPIPPKGSGPDQEPAHSTGGGLSRILFQLLDADRNGQLSVHEFQRLAEILEHAPGPPHDARRAEADHRPGAGPGHPPVMLRPGGPRPDRPSIARRGFPLRSPDHDGPKPPHQLPGRSDRGGEARRPAEESQPRSDRSRDDQPATGRGPDQPRGGRQPSRGDEPSQSEIVVPNNAQPVEVRIPKLSEQWI